MKILVFFLSIMGSLSLYAQNLNIQQPTKFQFIHCVPSEAADEDTVTHYVVDVRNNDLPILYSTSALKKLKSQELTDLTVLDDSLLSDTLSDVDLSWISVKNKLVIAIDISDKNGFEMTGELRLGRDKYPIHCVDSSLE